MPQLCVLSRTEDPARAGTCARDRRALEQLALNVHVKHSDLTSIVWATFRPTKFKTHYVAPQFYFRRTVQIAPKFYHWNAHIFLFCLILRDIPNSITPQTTLRLPPIPVGLHVLPCTRQCRRPHPPPPPLTPFPVTGVRYNSLLRMCTLTTDLT